MASSANLLEFGKGGGGLIGQDKDVILKVVEVVEHSFERKDKLTGEVTDTFEPGCMLHVAMEVEDPEDDNSRFTDQYYPIGNLPLSRLAELGYQADPKRPGGAGGYLPSTDNETPSTAGPFVILEGKTDIWEGCAHAQFIAEFLNLGLGEFADKVNAKGYSALNGTRVHLGIKALPKSKKAAADPTSKEKSILVPVKVNSWPWDAQPAASAQAATAKPKAAAKKAAASAPAAAATEAAPVAADSNGNGAVDQRTIAIIKEVLAAAGGSIGLKALPGKVFPIASKGGTHITKHVQSANSKDFLESYNGSEWLWDGDSETLMAIPS